MSQNSSGDASPCLLVCGIPFTLSGEEHPFFSRDVYYASGALDTFGEFPLTAHLFPPGNGWSGWAAMAFLGEECVVYVERERESPESAVQRLRELSQDRTLLNLCAQNLKESGELIGEAEFEEFPNG